MEMMKTARRASNDTQPVIGSLRLALCFQIIHPDYFYRLFRFFPL